MQNILNFESDYPDAHTVMLEQNYRSTPKHFNAANDVIANNVERKPKQLWTDNAEGAKISYYRDKPAMTRSISLFNKFANKLKKIILITVILQSYTGRTRNPD